MAADSHPTLAVAHRLVLTAAITLVTLTAWFWLTQGSAHHSTSTMLMHHHAPGNNVAYFVSVLIMWQAMSVAMMAPTTLNWLFAYAAIARTESAGVFRGVLAFVVGFFSIWLVYSAAAAGLQIALQHAGWLDGDGKLPSTAAGVVLAGAGIAYFTPLSRACLRHCRNPLTYFVSHWDNGPRGGFRFGVAHAAYCVGCCWLLMLTGFAMGVMNMIWMGFLTVLVCVEKLAPFGDRIAGVAAVAMILWGTIIAVGLA